MNRERNKAVRCDEMLISCAAGALEGSDKTLVMLVVDALEDLGSIDCFSDGKRLVLLTRSAETEKELRASEGRFRAVIKLPDVKLSRLGIIKLGVLIGLSTSVITPEDRLVCLGGRAGSKGLDTLIILDLSKESELFATMSVSPGLVKSVKPEVFETVVRIALQLASEGREGKPVGTTFVIGDYEKVSALARPLIMNPFQGYPEEARNIVDAAVHETIKEFSLLDGAFIIKEDGVVMAAGMHLNATPEKDALAMGLGCRHQAAAGITNATEAAAVTISGSTGIVRIFLGGNMLVEIERPAAGRLEDVLKITE